MKETAASPSLRIAADVGVLVAGMETSLSFYRDLIGLAIVEEVSTSLIGKGRMVQLGHGASLIKLVQLEDAPAQMDSASKLFSFTFDPSVGSLLSTARQ